MSVETTRGRGALRYLGRLLGGREWRKWMELMAPGGRVEVWVKEWFIEGGKDGDPSVILSVGGFNYLS